MNVEAPTPELEQSPPKLAAVPADPPKPRRGRPPLDPKRREEKARKEVVRRLAANAVEAKTEDEFFAKVDKLKAERKGTAPAAAAAPEVFAAKERTPSELAEEKRQADIQRIAVARAEIMGTLLGVAEAVGMDAAALAAMEKNKRINFASFCAAPWYADQPPMAELSPRAKKIGLVVGIAVFIGPAVFAAAKQHGPKVVAWWKEREAQRKAAHPA